MDNGASSYRRFLDGDESGIVEIVKEYKDGLILYLNNYVNNINIAEDLAEDTFVKLLTQRPKNNFKASFKTWLYVIGRNIAIDYLRKNSKAVKVSAEECSEIVYDEESVEKFYIKEENKKILHRALSKLRPEYRQILWLIYFENFTNKETAEIINKSVHNTETLLYRAKKSLKSELEKEGFSYEEL